MILHELTSDLKKLRAPSVTFGPFLGEGGADQIFTQRLNKLKNESHIFWKD